MATDPRALVRVLDEFLWTLRREGFDISTAQAIDVARAVDAVGLASRGRVREAIACVAVQRVTDRPRFDAAFADFFIADSAHAKPTVWQRLEAKGFAVAEIELLRSIWSQPGIFGEHSPSTYALLERGAEMNRLLARSVAARETDAHSGRLLGFLKHRVSREVGLGRARKVLEIVRSHLVERLGDRGLSLADALSEELEGSDAEIRAFVQRVYERKVAEFERELAERRLATTPFVKLTDAEVVEVRRAVRTLAEKLRASARRRVRRRRRGRFDVHRTLRSAFRTGGVPYCIARVSRRRVRPKVFILCDVSDSVRAAAAFLLEFTSMAQELLERARTFVFVSELEETTGIFAGDPGGAAIDSARRLGMGSGENSNYGRAFRSFETRHLHEVDRGTTVVILGDGRTNFHDAAAEVLDRIRDRAHALFWLCTEPRDAWGTGDSVMARYATRCTLVQEVTCVRDFERAARRLVGRS